MEESWLEISILPDSIEDGALFNIILQDLIDQLPAKNRAVLGLLTASYTQQEAANLLGISRTSVGNIFRRTISILRDGLCD